MYTIKEVATKLNLPVSTIRFYERKGLVKPERQANNYRAYQEADIQTLQLLLVMKYADFSLKEMSELLALDLFSIPTADCVAQTNQLIDQKSTAITKKIETYQQILNLLATMRPLANQAVDEPSLEQFNQEVATIFNTVIQEAEK